MAKPVPKPPERKTPRFDLAHWVPAISMLRDYRRAWLAKDLFAGLVLTAMLVPVGMSYAEAAGLPVLTGLYASIAALIGYAVFGPSRILVLGPDSALAALIAATVLPLSSTGAAHTVALASMLATMAGAACALFGLMKLGFVSDLLSDPIRYGYLNGIAVTLAAGQLPQLLGFSGGGGSFLGDVLNAYQALLTGQIQVATAAIGLACVAVILALRTLAPGLPGIFIVFVIAAGAGWWLRHAYQVLVPVIGAIPSGLTLPRLPSVSWPEIRRLSGGAVAIALVSFADISVLSRVFASRADRNADRNQELIALGAANLLAGFLQGCPVTSSSSRTPVAQAAGAQTQVTGIVSALCIAALLLFAPSLLAHVPHAALAAVVICASIAVMQIRNVARLYRRRRSEFAISLLCLLGVVLLGVVQGIFLAVGLALLSFVWRAWHPYDAVLGRVTGVRGYHDVTRHPDARQMPGLVLFRWDAPLFFANANIFSDHLRRAIAQAPSEVQWAIVAAEPITDIDVTAADVLDVLHDELRAEGVRLCFAEMKGPVKDLLRQYGLFQKFSNTAPFFATVGEAVEHCVASRGSPRSPKR
ncbi:sodium-independent anion transporter [Trinickia dabaoshanensis]|uniref:Sodium-independent anion transporter n=1 Tax=Trinickia dabaoshanensis TaxID=564714 RepID=A0A2N7VVE4_9BURK|nr:SulP family inorganic anion transporter [Trinickia dabaoshanensis]PMS21122.1 sodium-independent anion transporter [Trinickia dabaoshanensis]